MKLKFLLSTSFIAAGFFATAQDAGKSFAITSDGQTDFMWMNIRQIDLSTGKTVQQVYQRNITAFVMMDADTKKPVINNPGYREIPLESMVAAAAYDKNQNKLFFTPMRIGELRWLDLNAKGDEQKYYTLKSNLLNDSKLLSDEANHFTRMVIAADGNGYALTNDGNRLIRFTTGKKVVITDLGNVIDDAANKDVSIHNRCTSWGGDMIADAFNKLYIISANRNIFELNIETRVATHLGIITGLPPTYTTNGAAVAKDGSIVLSSASCFAGLYKMTINNFEATKIEGSDMTYNASDLANGNLLFQKEADASKKYIVADFKPVVPVINPDPHIFPNPVTSGEFKVFFDGLKAGRYTITITDLSGKPLMINTVNNASKSQVETVKLNRSFAKGMYMVKVTDAENNFVFTERIIVQ